MTASSQIITYQAQSHSYLVRRYITPADKTSLTLPGISLKLIVSQLAKKFPAL
jgi:hypothetical protein